MNRRAERFLREQMRGDGRNPYGSRGGYVTSRSPRRGDRGEYDERGGDYRGGYSDGHYRGEHERYPYEEMRGDFERTRQYYDGNRPNDMRGDYRDYGEDYRGGRGGGRGGRDSRGGDYGDYGDYGEEDYRGRSRNSRGQFTSRRDRGDYGDEQDMRLSKEELKEWEKKLVNEDGSRGAHFDKEQIDQAARSMGIEPQEFGEGVLCATVNMMYSDYVGVAKKFGVDRIEYYIELAKAFLKDKDFDGDGAEKLFLYYTFIADDEK